MQLADERERNKVREEALRAEVEASKAQCDEQKELVKQCKVQIDHFEKLNTLRDDLMSALEKENKKLKD